MCITSGTAPRLDAGNVDIIAGCEHHRIFGNLIVVESKPATGGQPCVLRKHRNCTVIAMTVNRPLSKNDIGTLRNKESSEAFVMRFVDDGATIELIGENSTSF